MRTILGILIIAFVIVTSSCDKEDVNQVDFLNLNDRTGYWINSERGDTLYFINDKDVKRLFNGEEDFLYKIYDNTLFLKIPTSLTETRHNIMENNEDKVQINNMYRGHEGTINYGIYRKLNN